MIELTKMLRAVVEHGYMAENVVKRTCSGTMLQFKIQKDEKISF